MKCEMKGSAWDLATTGGSEQKARYRDARANLGRPSPPRLVAARPTIPQALRRMTDAAGDAVIAVVLDHVNASVLTDMGRKTFYPVTKEDMRGQSRQEHLVQGRLLATVVCKNGFGATDQRIAEIVGKDRSTVIHAFARACRDAQKYPERAALFRELEAKAKARLDDEATEVVP